MAVKRKLEFDDYSNMTDEAESANIHGIVTKLSPVKKSKNDIYYYDGQICDGKQSLRFVGFDSSQREIFQGHLKKKNSIEIRRCQIKKSKLDMDKLEILVKQASIICPSTKTFDVSAVEFENTGAIDITLNQVDQTKTRTTINVDVKVVSCGEPITLGTKQKQDVHICDNTGWAILQLWEENIGLLMEGCSYHLKHFRIAEFEKEKFIAMWWEGSEIHRIEELENTVDPPLDAAVVAAKCITLQNPRIAAVCKLEKVFKCLKCGSDTEPAQTNEVRCKCGTLNNSTYCDSICSAEIVIIDGDRKIPLIVLGDMIAQLLDDINATPTEEALLRSPPITELKYCNNKIIEVVRQ